MDSSRESMKIGLIYRNVAVTSAGLAGGGDVFVIYLLRALKELGYYVIFATTKPTDWVAIESGLGWIYMPDEERRITLMPDVDGFRLYRNLLPSIPLRKLKRDCNVTFDAYGMNILWDVDLMYLHTPPTKEEIESKYMGSWYRRFYYKTYLSLSEKRMRRLRRRILTNSEYSKKIIHDVYGLDSIVIYPPVDTSLYSRLLSSLDRKNIVLTIGRYSWEKKLELIPEIAKMVPDAEFHIIGTTALTYASDVIKCIRSKASELGVSNRVHLHIDVPLWKKFEIMAKAKVYLSMRRDEYFGIAIAEAMSAGIVPIVPNSGGQVEIVHHNKDFMYEDIESAAMLVKEWLIRWNRSIAREVSSMAEKFSYDRFKREIDSVIRSTLSNAL